MYSLRMDAFSPRAVPSCLLCHTAAQTNRYGGSRVVAVRTEGEVMRFEEPGVDGVSRSDRADGGTRGGGYLQWVRIGTGGA